MILGKENKKIKKYGEQSGRFSPPNYTDQTMMDILSIKKINQNRRNISPSLLISLAILTSLAPILYLPLGMALNENSLLEKEIVFAKTVLFSERIRLNFPKNNLKI